MIAIVWIVSILWIIPITTWPYIVNNGTRIVPENECDTEYKHNLAFKLITAIFNFYVPLIAMIIINTKIYLVIRKRYRNPIMQYISGPNSKYSWVNQQENGDKSAKRSIGSIITVATAVVLNKKESEKENNGDHFQAPRSSTQDIKVVKKHSQNMFMKLNKSIPKLFQRKYNRNKSSTPLHKQNSINSERYMNIDYNNYSNPSPIYTPIKKNNLNNDTDNIQSFIDTKDAELNLVEMIASKTSLNRKVKKNLDCSKQYEEESFLNETLKIDEFYNNLLNEASADLKTSNNSSYRENSKSKEDSNAINNYSFNKGLFINY
jgi:hypothetical protein